MGDNECMTEGEFLSQYRREGKDWQFQWYLLGQHVRILGAVIVRELGRPLVPFLDWLERRLTK